MDGGAISISECMGRAISCREGIVMTEGSIAIDKQSADPDGYYNSAAAVDAYGAITIKGGSFNVTRVSGCAISVKDPAFKTANGKIVVTKGSLTATVLKPAKHYAIDADAISIAKAAKAKVSGCVRADGFKFKKGGNEYVTIRQKMKKGNGAVTTEFRGVKLAKYNAKSTKLKLKRIKYAGYTYDIAGVGSKAFATKRGAQVKSITLSNDIHVLDAKAFAGTKSLTKLVFNSHALPPFEITASGKVKWSSESSVHKKAFSGCGKGKGKYLVVDLDIIGNLSKSDEKAYRKLLIAKGMPKGFKIVTS